MAPITADDVSMALEEMIAADAAWQAALERVYGKRAGDARYDNRGHATVELAGLKAGFHSSMRDYRVLLRAARP